MLGSATAETASTPVQFRPPTRTVASPVPGMLRNTAVLVIGFPFTPRVVVARLLVTQGRRPLRRPVVPPPPSRPVFLPAGRPRAVGLMAPMAASYHTRPLIARLSLLSLAPASATTRATSSPARNGPNSASVAIAFSMAAIKRPHRNATLHALVTINRRVVRATG